MKRIRKLVDTYWTIKQRTKSAEIMPKQKSYSVSYKVRVIDWYNANGKSIHKAANEFGVDHKRIREWLQNEHVLGANNRGNSAKRLRFHQGIYLFFFFFFFFHLFYTVTLSIKLLI